MLLAYRQKPSFFAVGQELGQHHQTVQRCVERALAYGPLAALDDRPRPGKGRSRRRPRLGWYLACDKAKEHGYPHELWTTRLLARHAREQGPAAGHECLANLVQGTVCKILGQEEIKPHKALHQHALGHRSINRLRTIEFVNHFPPEPIGAPLVSVSLTKGMIAADFLADPPGTGLDSPPKRTVRVPR
jgi:hypothetical protein